MNRRRPNRTHPVLYQSDDEVVHPSDIENSRLNLALDGIYTLDQWWEALFGF